MPPPQLPPSERADEVVPPTISRRRHIGKLFWVGVTLAPIAALLLVIANGVGPLRAAAALAVLSVVIIGLSVVLRDDAAMVKDDVEDQLRTEVDRLRSDIDSLRRGVEVSVHRELERVHRELDATRRDYAVRAEAGRMNHNRLTAGELPAADEEYADGRQRRGGDSRGRSPRPIRAITARSTENAAAAPGDPGYDWFGAPESPAEDERREPREAATGRAPRGDAARADAPRGESARADASRGDTARFEATTYGTARPPADQGGGASYPTDGGWPQRGAESSDAGADGRGRRRRAGSTYGADGVATGAAKPVGTENGSSASRRGAVPEGTTYEATTYGATVYGSAASAADEPADEAPGRGQPDRWWTDEPSAGDQAPNYQLIDYDDAPPVYQGERGGSGVYRGSRAAQTPPEAAGSGEQPEDDGAGAVDYDDFWARSATPPRSAPAARSGGDQDAGAEWSSWRETGSEWDTGQQRYNRDDPYVITGAITGAILDIPYTVGGQALSEPDFGTGNGFGSGSGFGAGTGFAADQPRWDEPSAPEGWPGKPAASGADSGAPSEFELPNLDHLPRAGGSAQPQDPTGGRHARRAR